MPTPRVRTDLRRELIGRLYDPETRQRIADALITEAEGGPADPKSGQPKGGATVIRAFELIRELALEPEPEAAPETWDLSAYDDAALYGLLERLGASGDDGPWTSGTPPNVAGEPRTGGTGAARAVPP